MPSRRHCRQTGPIYLAKLLSPYLFSLRCGLRPWQAFVPLKRSLTVAAPIRAARVSKRDRSIYLAKLLSPYLFSLRCGLRPWQAFVPLKRSLTVAAPIRAARVSKRYSHYTRRFLGGRHPLCGMGVTSLMARTSIPAVLNARTADSRPEPGPETRTSTTRSPLSFALLAAVMAACWAAKGVPLRDPRKPSEPALDQEIVLPS